MDIGYLLKILARRKWLILSVMLASAALMFFLIGRKPEAYRSTVMVSTGIVNYKGINSSGSDGFVQPYQIANAFSNLIEIIQSQAAVKLLTMQMLKHDLAAEFRGEGTPFRTANKELSDFQEEDALALLDQINEISFDSISHPSFTADFDYKLDKIARAYGYDNDAIMRSLEVKRKGETDYLTVSFVSDKPDLSQNLANTFCRQFLTYYQNLRQSTNREKVDFHTDLVRKKKNDIDSLQNGLYAYRRTKSLPTYNR